MSKPVKHYGAYRIRWIDAEGKRQSETHETFSVAQRRLREHESSGK